MFRKYKKLTIKQYHWRAGKEQTMADVDFASISKKLKKLRLEQELTQEYVALRTGCNVSHISNIENNRVKVSLSTLVSMCNALHTTVDYVLAENYSSPSDSLDRAILEELKGCDAPAKETVFQIIRVIKNNPPEP